MTRRALAPLAVAAVLALSACGDSDPSTVESPPEPTPLASSAAPTSVASAVPSDTVDRTISVTVADGKVAGGVKRVKVALNSRIRITVLTDEADELHVHLYDLRKDLAANQPGSVEFVADTPGVVEVELHDSGTPLLSLQIS